MDIYLLLHILGAVCAASVVSYGIANVPTLHPQVRRGLQLASVALAVWYALRLVGAAV